MGAVVTGGGDVVVDGFVAAGAGAVMVGAVTEGDETTGSGAAEEAGAWLGAGVELAGSGLTGDVAIGCDCAAGTSPLASAWVAPDESGAPFAHVPLVEDFD